MPPNIPVRAWPLSSHSIKTSLLKYDLSEYVVEPALNLRNICVVLCPSQGTQDKGTHLQRAWHEIRCSLVLPDMDAGLQRSW